MMDAERSRTWKPREDYDLSGGCGDSEKRGALDYYSRWQRKQKIA
jgi:hypothetical protein